MELININKVSLRQMLNIYDDNNINNLLFEIVYFLSKENRIDGIFTLKDVEQKTKYRISTSVSEDIQCLIEKGFVNPKGAKYVIMKHPWF